jgi:hypothetical protein
MRSTVPLGPRRQRRLQAACVIGRLCLQEWGDFVHFCVTDIIFEWLPQNFLNVTGGDFRYHRLQHVDFAVTQLLAGASLPLPLHTQAPQGCTAVTCSAFSLMIHQQGMRCSRCNSTILHDPAASAAASQSLKALLVGSTQSFAEPLKHTHQFQTGHLPSAYRTTKPPFFNTAYRQPCTFNQLSLASTKPAESSIEGLRRCCCC